MQFKTLFSVAMTVAAVAAQAQPVIDILTEIDTSIKDLTTDVTAWDGDVVKATGVLNKAEALLKQINDSVPKVAALTAFPLNDAVKILQPGNAIIADTGKVTDALVAKKPLFDKNSLSSVVKETLTKFNTAAGALIGAVKPKLPANVQSVGDSIGKQIVGKLQTGLTAFA